MVNKNAEKRQFQRIGIRAPIRCQIRGETRFNNSICDNISLGGISFTTNEFIPTAAPVMIEVTIYSRVLRFVGKIAWSQTLPHSDKNRLGVEFLETNHNEINYLQEFINMAHAA